jgi:hypothetical protein
MIGEANGQTELGSRLVLLEPDGFIVAWEVLEHKVIPVKHIRS